MTTKPKKPSATDRQNSLVSYETFYDELSNSGVCPKCGEHELCITFHPHKDDHFECMACEFKCELNQIKN
jgi:hypothetical protein